MMAAVHSADKAETAVEYAEKCRWAVFPCKPWPDKAPLVKNGFKDATLDPAQIRTWWRQWPNAAVAIATGQRSKIVIFDVDTKDDAKNGIDSLEELGLSILPETPISHTGPTAWAKG